jgi:transcription elongation factor GreA
MVTYISKEQYEKLKKELEYLKTEGRKEIAERLKNAIEMGDISENAEYDTAIAAKEDLERKIAEFENILKTAKIIRDSKINDRILPGK